MRAKSPEWVNLMLDAVDPRKPNTSATLEELTKRARTIAIKRTRQLGQPDAHAVRVATLAAETARRHGMGNDEIDAVVEGALLHDIGKAQVPRAILDQCRPLTRAEFLTVMQHPAWGAALVKGHVSERALLAIRHHHEWWNGEGYPAKLAAHDIPIEARIVGIADAFVAMREERPYRPPRSIESTVDELRQGAGTQFDPQLVDPLIDSMAADDTPPLRMIAH
ncbi:MAG TPA: HD domain-containing phosphohydrolase [Gaiellaceae bacterium]|nr:HD domain-containing phosphohydrolase [Gaiellaceae bacterium]